MNASFSAVFRTSTSDPYSSLDPCDSEAVAFFGAEGEPFLFAELFACLVFLKKEKEAVDSIRSLESPPSWTRL